MNNINGLILAGGESSRMGTDKSVLEFHGVPQREHLHRLLKQFCDEVFVSCKAKHTVPDSLNPLPDKFNIKSPLNGILSAFERSSSTAWVTVPVDMPFIDHAAIEYLLQKRVPGKVATCFYDSDGKYPEPLFTVWEIEAGPLLKAFYKQGNFSPREFLLTHEVSMVVTPKASISTNINSIEDLKAFQEKKPQ